MSSVKKEVNEPVALQAALAALEAALLDDVEHYGPTPRARDALAELDGARSVTRPSSTP